MNGVSTPQSPSILTNGSHPAWERLHEEACARGEEFYPDPDTGLWVGTRIRLLARGFCCGNGCRHCPYAARNEPLAHDEIRP